MYVRKQKNAKEEEKGDAKGDIELKNMDDSDYYTRPACMLVLRRDFSVMKGDF